MSTNDILGACQAWEGRALKAEKELAETKANLHAAELEIVELRGELHEKDDLIQDLYDKTRGQQPF